MFKNVKDLEIERKPRYLSPSSLSAYLKMPNTFFLERLIEDRKARDPQSLAAGVGTAFDILVKKELIKRGIPCKVPMTDIEKSLDNPEVVDESYEIGNDLLKIYKRSKLLLSTKWHEVEGVHDFQLRMRDENGKTMGSPVPIMGKLDAQVYDEEYDMIVPMDWKCSGWTSKNGVSPQKGFKRIFNSKKNLWEGCHKTYTEEIEAKDINISWAKQFCVYGWFMLADEKTGIYNIREFPVYAHHPIFNGKGKIIKIAEYRAIVTVDFQKELFKEFQRVWKELQDGEILDKIASKKSLSLVYSQAATERWF